MTTYIESHGYRFGVNTENDHNGDWRSKAALATKAELDGMSAQQVGALHNALERGHLPSVAEDYYTAVRAGEMVNRYDDFIVSLDAA